MLTSKTTFSFILLGIELHQFDFLQLEGLVCFQSEVGNKIHFTNYFCANARPTKLNYLKKKIDFVTIVSHALCIVKRT